LLGMCKNWELADEQARGLSLVVLVVSHSNEELDLAACLIFVNSCHYSMAGTGAVCMAECSRIARSLVQRELRPGAQESQYLRINHPLGAMQVGVQVASRESTLLGKMSQIVNLRYWRSFEPRAELWRERSLPRKPYETASRASKC